MEGGGGGGGSVIGGGGGGGGSDGGGGGRGAGLDGGGANAFSRGDVGGCGPSLLAGRNEEEDALGLSLKDMAVCLAFSAVVGSCGGAVLLGPAPLGCACKR